MSIIDFHTHIFPDAIAPQAVGALAAESGNYRPCTDGTLSGLLASMDSAGIAASVVANIATKPSQMLPIFDFCKRIKSDRIHPLISFHPTNDFYDVEDLFNEASAAGIRGVKLHPMYQQFMIDNKHMYAFYELIASFGFYLMFHSGFDMAFPDNRQADVERVKKVAGWFKDLTIVCTHLGGWKQWERAHLLADCENVYTETSMVVTETTEDVFLKTLLLFDEDRVLFGTDSPWTDQKAMVEHARSLKLPDGRKEKLLRGNAVRLQGLPG